MIHVLQINHYIRASNIHCDKMTVFGHGHCMCGGINFDVILNNYSDDISELDMSCAKKKTGALSQKIQRHHIPIYAHDCWILNIPTLK